MLIEFRFKNYRSFRDEATLSMEATGLNSFKNSLIPLSSTVKLLPAVAIYGKNGGGKSNVIRAFWLAVQFIRNAQRTQHEGANIPVNCFALNDYSNEEPTEFHFIYTINGIKFWYGFSATRERIFTEYLYHAPKGQKALIFSREGQKFTFTEEKTKRGMISEMVAENQLFFSVACTMNDSPCISAMHWYRNHVFFSRDYSDIPKQLLAYSEDKNMLKAISDYAKTADLGSNVQLKVGEVSAKARHLGEKRDGQQSSYMLELEDESDGTRKLMALAPAIESALCTGGILLVDELERELHPKLVNFIVAKFQSKSSNPNRAQIVFTTHNTELMNLELLRKDQLYFVDKYDKDGTSELYSISEFAARTTEDVRKGYLVGKYGATPDIEIEEVE